jgi:hypothetical protein
MATRKTPDWVREPLRRWSALGLKTKIWLSSTGVILVLGALAFSGVNYLTAKMAAEEAGSARRMNEEGSSAEFKMGLYGYERKSGGGRERALGLARSSRRTRRSWRPTT